MNRFCIVAVLCPLLLSLLFFYFMDYYVMCGKDIIADVCELYEQKAVAGSLCQGLCATKSITTKNCMSTSPEKAVYKATWKDKEIVIKQVYSTSEVSYSFEHLKSEEDFKNEIRATVHMLFDECENCSKLTEKLVDIADVDRDGQLSMIETKTIVKLLRTPEPAMLLVLNGSKVSLNLYGYCGPVYAVEKVPMIADTTYGFEWQFYDLIFLPNIFEPVELMIKDSIQNVAELLSNFHMIESIFGPMIHYFRHFVYKHLFRHRAPILQERFNFTMSLLNGIFSLSDNTYGMIQACDTHLGNFGLSHDNEFKLIDLDQVYPQHYLRKLLSSKKCHSDEDCRVGDFLECSSSCNTDKGFCTAELKKQMLHNLCPSSFPLIFRYIHKDFEGQNEKYFKCLEVAIGDVASYCLNIPLANNITDLHKQIEEVKERIVNISMGKFHCKL